jgi:hypothetical protein
MSIFALLTILTAGARFAATPSASPLTTAIGSTPAAAPAAIQSVGTSCSAFAEQPQGNGSASQGELVALVRQFLQGAPGSTKPALSPLPKGITFLVATVPDPLHTLLNLQFDRTIDAIQQAAQDEGFTYDSSWLPWKAQAADYSGRVDQTEEDKDLLQRELCPGLILFRQSMHRSSAQHYDETYTNGLFVFLVGEKPTTGINRIQWDNALEWINLHADKTAPDRALRVLGPNFSGSAPSVARAVVDPGGQAKSFSSVLLYTGTMHGCSSFLWLKNELRQQNTTPVRAATFDENDSIQVDRYFRYLKDRGHSISEVAILSEDETAYGGLPDVPLTTKPDASDAKRVNAAAKPDASGTEPPSACLPSYKVSDGTAPLHLYYPRDISALRSAYQEQSIFSQSTGDKSSSAHVVLQPQATRSTHRDTDTIPTFSGPNSALAQEAQMYGIVDSLRTHGVRFVVLRSTSSLDNLFLTRFLHRAYPDAFIVTIGADLLFGREIDSTEFRGVEALTAFPLLPRGQDWTRGAFPITRHAHRVFGSDTMEGTYLAARFLITDLGATPGEQSPYIHPYKPDVPIPDFRSPFWDKPSSGTDAPPTWLSVVGRDGYWPVAVLTEPLSESVPPVSPVSTVALMGLPKDSGTGAKTDPGLWKFTLSPAWRFCCGLALLAVCLHFYACLCGRRSENQSMFIQFVPLTGNRQLFLIGLGWAIIGSIAILMLRCATRISAFISDSNSIWISVLYIAAWLACIGIVLDISLRSFGEPRSMHRVALRAWKRQLRGRPGNGVPILKRALGAIIWIAFPIVLLWGAYWIGTRIFDYPGPNGLPPNPNGVPTAFRAVHLTNGVSPMVSLLLLLCGFYCWFWQTLSGLALQGEGRPILPSHKYLARGLARISDSMACNIEARAIPLPGFRQISLYLLPIAILALPLYALRHEGPDGFDPILHSLENRPFNETLHALLALALYILLFECAQLVSTWLSLKRLLLALNRTPLRRTFTALQGLSMRSLWNLSGTSSRARYTIYSHQLESLLRLRNVLRLIPSCGSDDAEIRASIEAACERGRRFVEKRSKTADLAMVNDRDGRQMREVFCGCAEQILNDLILPEWSSETDSMDLLKDGEKADSNFAPPLSRDEPTRHAEEFVCLIYVGYLQNLLGRMRTMVLSIGGVLAGFAFSLAFYPYVPRPTLAIVLLMLVAVLGSAVALVYAGLERDSTLSRITNTEPGKLGAGFWLRYGSFIGVPILGLLVAQFPAITDFVTSWIEPGLNAAK